MSWCEFSRVNESLHFTWAEPSLREEIWDKFNKGKYATVEVSGVRHKVVEFDNKNKCDFFLYEKVWIIIFLKEKLQIVSFPPQNSNNS